MQRLFPAEIACPFLKTHAFKNSIPGGPVSVVIVIKDLRVHKVRCKWRVSVLDYVMTCLLRIMLPVTFPENGLHTNMRFII
jgi:hypothetical protein